MFDSSEKYRLIDEYGTDSFSENSGGRLYFERDFVSYKNMREWAFSFGDKVTILAPEKLRDDIVQNAKIFYLNMKYSCRIRPYIIDKSRWILLNVFIINEVRESLTKYLYSKDKENSYGRIKVRDKL